MDSLQNYLLEASVDSVESAIAAQRGGADRLELCGGLMIGGVTPSIELYRSVRRHTTMKINVLLRPRFGDFLYSEYEFEILFNEAELFLSEGADAVVCGCLTPDGQIDRERMRLLADMAHKRGGKITLHRAFDMCRDAFDAYRTCGQIGIDTILTSGQANSCTDGISLIRELAAMQDGPEILVGAGVDAQAIALLTKETAVRSFHMSGKKTVDSGMVYRKKDVTMGLPILSEYDVWQTDESKIREAKTALRTAFDNA